MREMFFNNCHILLSAVLLKNISRALNNAFNVGNWLRKQCKYMITAHWESL